MKNLTLLCGLFLLITSLSAQKNEDLLNILKKETEAFANANFDAWQSCWSHTENAYFSYAEQGSLFSVKGWTNIETAFKEAFKNRKKYDANFRRENIQVKRQGDWAFITFEQYDKLNDKAAEVHKQESRVMKKAKDGWKILSAEIDNLTSFDRTGKELHHILLASFIPEAPASDIQYIYDQFKSIVGKVEGMKSCTMLKNEDKSSPFHYTFIMTFSSEEALRAYEAHANHQAAVERWIKAGNKVTVIDSWK